MDLNRKDPHPPSSTSRSEQPVSSQKIDDDLNFSDIFDSLEEDHVNRDGAPEPPALSVDSRSSDSLMNQQQNDPPEKTPSSQPRKDGVATPSCSSWSTEESLLLSVLQVLYNCFLLLQYRPPQDSPPQDSPPQYSPPQYSPPQYRPPQDSPPQYSPPQDPAACLIPVESDESMYEQMSFPLEKTPRAPSPSPSVYSMKSDLSMYEPYNFLPQVVPRSPGLTGGTVRDFLLMRQRDQAGLRSCSVCEKDLKDPVKLPCGHWSCRQCSSSGSQAGCSCKTCGKNIESDPDHQTDTEEDADDIRLSSTSPTEPGGGEKKEQKLRAVLLQKKIKRVEMETEKLQAEKEKLQVEKERAQVEKERAQVEKERAQVETDKLELEKTKLALQIQFMQQRTNSKV